MRSQDSIRRHLQEGRSEGKGAVSESWRFCRCPERRAERNFRHGRDTKEALQRAKESRARIRALVALGRCLGMHRNKPSGR